MAGSAVSSTMTSPNSTDWAAWSRESVQLMSGRNSEWTAKWKLSGAPYTWDLKAAQIRFEGNGFDVLADVCCIGTVSSHEKTFLWAWANEGIPEVSRRGLDRIREFGKQNHLTLLTTPECHGGVAEGKEMVAIAGRILDAEGTWIDTCHEVAFFFVLSRFREQPPAVRSRK